MSEWTFDPLIADEIVVGRILRIPTLRAMAQRNGGPLSDALWPSIEPKWKWHDAMSSEELQARLGVRPD